jgi:glycosyltransferase involved in cell wall biosynthesis
MFEGGKNGILVPPGDADALAAAMQQLIDDPAYCQRLGEAAQAYAANFMAEVSVPRFEQLYQRVLRHCSAQSATMQLAVTREVDA